uniref:Uncharacterized protein n=1 Tax=Candidatus Kentrum sp. FM TaxID=2126340 RepID=A0A450SAR2_9GAMM|nr:MAG: hypothetical protein BECKFM1743C_GA0114222_100684 [Candidatus Kentron sp. FM]VFJ70571.1 MAG: hypothetical protein BECKFM1743A_GA0114220_105541 [Candidatus Kentron sp. FM]VFK11357.1 MAG: hypothetical protein BECKFM1743B_GA0114221_101778 [Candidatus Kentron sp. FM]
MSDFEIRLNQCPTVFHQMSTQPSGPFHLNFDVNGDNKCSNARRACAVIVNYFKHVQRGRRALGILRLTLKFKWNGPLDKLAAQSGICFSGNHLML